MKTDIKVKGRDEKKGSSVPVMQKPGVKAVYDSIKRQLHGAHGIGCKN